MGSFGPSWQLGTEASSGEHGQGDERVWGAVPSGEAVQDAEMDVGGLRAGIAQVELQGAPDQCPRTADRPGELDEKPSSRGRRAQASDPTNSARPRCPLAVQTARSCSLRR